ncbi:hypothetical protein T261_8449 [Streptomyces lydicus]|nr:hypothetical protein T261_8449 [Streptomyces lydicus]
MSNPIVKALERAAEKLGKTLGKDAGKAVEDLYHETGHRMKKVAANHAENEAKQAEAFGRHLKGDKGDMPHEPHGTGGGARPGAKSGDGPKNNARAGTDEDPQNAGRPERTKCPGGEPIDMATGRMFLPQTDLTLPGRLPLVLSRKFESSYRSGRWFGPTWSGTLDQRLEIDTKGVIFVHEDGMLLAYPHPEPSGDPVLPAVGPRWPLRRDGRGDYFITDPATGRTWNFDAPTAGGSGLAPLQEISDRSGHWITFEYDETGAPTGIRHSGGYQIHLTTEGNRITALYLANGAPDGNDQLVLQYGYDAAGHLSEVTNPAEKALRFAYDPEGRIVSWIDSNARSYEFVYDEHDRCIFQSGTEGNLRNSLDYGEVDPATGHRVVSLTNSLGHTTRYLVNKALQVVAETDPTGATTRTERDRYHRLLSTTDPLGAVTRYAYDDSGNLTAVVNPDGSQTTAVYSSLGLPTCITAPDGAVWQQEFDERGNRTSATDPHGATTHYAYDRRGHLTAITDALGNTTRIECNPAGLPVTLTDPLGAVTRYRRDAMGRTTSVTDPLGGRTHLTWTVEGRLAARAAPDGTRESWSYDGEGNCTAHTDAAGGTTTYEYTHFDLLAAQTGPDGVRYEFAHDTELRLIQVTNPLGLTWSYAYDPAGRLVSETDFDQRTHTYTHDLAGRLTGRTNALGQTITYTHDILGRIVEKSVDGRTTTYSYDVAGRLLQATAPDTTLSCHYERAGRLTSETVNGRTVTSAYDEIGRRTQRVTHSGAVSTWTYDAAGRSSALTTSGHTLAFEHDAAGRELARHLGETLTVTSVRDATGRLREQSLSGAGTRSLQRRAYTYRSDGSLVGVDDQLNGTRTFALDIVGRVTAVQAQGWTESYAYDAMGNQSEANWPEKHTGSEALGARTYLGTRLTGAGRIRYEYDAQGRIILRQKTRLSRNPDTWRYSWDAEDRLTAVTTPDGQTWRYLYDPYGRRTEKQRMGPDGRVLEQTEFTWDGAHLAEQTTTAGDSARTAVTLTWDYDGMHPIAQTEQKSRTAAKTLATVPQPEIDQPEVNKRFFAVITDLVGSPTELVDEAGSIAWRTRSTLWGATTWSRHSTAYTPLRFPGQYFDPESGLHYNFRRYYDPETARYASPRPAGAFPDAESDDICTQPADSYGLLRSHA